jgi:serine protease Do
MVVMTFSVPQTMFGFASASDTTTHHAANSERTLLPIAEGLSDRFRSAAQQVLPSVVEIKVALPRAVPWNAHRGQHRFEAIPFEGFLEETEYEMDEEVSESVLGCGVIIDPSGIVLTNCHVVEESDEMLVELPDGRLYKVNAVRKDEKTDLAVLSVNCTEPLLAAQLGDSENLRIGDWVLSIGSPFELEQTVSAGIISAKGRSVRGAGKTRLLQTDAAINPGSSGGALVNLRGEVVGITTAIASRDGGYQGVGFAIPINLAKWVSAELREHGHVRRGSIGVTTTKTSSRVTGRLGALRGGVLVARVAENSPAYKAGVIEKDTILSFDSRPIYSSSELDEIVEQVAVGSKHQLEILREEIPQTLDVTIEQAFGGQQALSSAHLDVDSPSELVYSHDLELAVSDLSKRSAGQLGLQTTEGLLIVRVDRGGAAFRAGIRKGMVIVRVGNRLAKNTEDFAQIMDQEFLKKGIWLQVNTGGRSWTIRVGGS